MSGPWSPQANLIVGASFALSLLAAAAATGSAELARGRRYRTPGPDANCDTYEAQSHGAGAQAPAGGHAPAGQGLSAELGRGGRAVCRASGRGSPLRQRGGR